MHVSRERGRELARGSGSRRGPGTRDKKKKKKSQKKRRGTWHQMLSDNCIFDGTVRTLTSFQRVAICVSLTDVSFCRLQRWEERALAVDWLIKLHQMTPRKPAHHPERRLAQTATLTLSVTFLQPQWKSRCKGHTSLFFSLSVSPSPLPPPLLPVCFSFFFGGCD